MTDDLPIPVVRPLKPDATDADGPLFSADQMRAYRAAAMANTAGVDDVLKKASVWACAVGDYRVSPAKELASSSCTASYRAFLDAVNKLARPSK